jgi:hypothetical protein
MLHTSLTVSTDVLSSVIAFMLLESIIGKKRRDVKGKSKVVLYCCPGFLKSSLMTWVCHAEGRSLPRSISTGMSARPFNCRERFFRVT